MGTYEAHEQVELVEDGGLVRSAERSFNIQIPCSGLLLGEVFALAANDPSVPKPGELLSSAWPYVRCRRRRAKLVSSTGTVAVVALTCGYEYEEPNPTYALRGGSSCSQIETQYDYDGDRITVTYEGTTYTGTITPLVPQQHLTLECSVQTNAPDTWVALYVGNVNLTAWRNGAAKEWLCTSGEYELRDKLSTPRWYHFVFTFERKIGGWVYHVAYRDPDGNIPNSDSAITEVDYHGVAEFSTTFGP